ncbi:MAG TPA: hypothetical protein VGQ83_29050 [Polyangia bacterium]|jgi:hypothetical protein
MADILETVLLLALPASGKSEVRTYLARLSPDECRRDFHMGATVQLDDYPYVHLMRRIDDELAALGQPRLFFKSPAHPFQNGWDWGTLIHLVNEDYDDLVARRVRTPATAAGLLFERLDAAAAKVGLPARLAGLDAGVRGRLAAALEADAALQLREKHENYPDTLAGKTLVLEFARGGAQGSAMPLEPPFGYRYSVGQLSPAILEHASILYVWVTPEESRRKNEERARPGADGSILHHGVPIAVMLGDYGCDDMDWLEAHSDQPGTAAIAAHGRTYHLPVGRFDNRVDKTSFIREDAKTWKPADVAAVHAGLKAGFDRLVAK